MNEKILQKIRRVNDDPELKKIDSRIVEFQELLKKKKQELAEARNYPSAGGIPSQSRPDAEADAKFLIGGGDISELAGAHTQDRKRDIARQISAIEKSVGVLEVDRRHRLKIAIKKSCDSLPDEVTAIFAEILKTGRTFAAAIETAQKLDSRLNDFGIDVTRRPMHLTVPAYFQHLLTGTVLPGSGGGLASLPFMLDSYEGAKSENAK